MRQYPHNIRIQLTSAKPFHSGERNNEEAFRNDPPWSGPASRLFGGTNRRACYKMRSHILKTLAVERSIFYSFRKCTPARLATMCATKFSDGFEGVPDCMFDLVRGLSLRFGVLSHGAFLDARVR